MDYPNAEIWLWTQVILVLSLCVVLISTVLIYKKFKRKWKMTI